MNALRIGLVLMLAAGCAPLLERKVAAQSESSFDYSRLSVTIYDESRLGYNSLPVQVVGAGGGKLPADERFRVIASSLKNATAKNVKAVKCGYFIFASKNLDEILEKGETALLPVDLAAFQTRRLPIHVLYVDNKVPLFKNNPGERYRIEVAVTEVQYEDGSSWRGTELPQKVDPAKPHRVTGASGS